MATRAVRSLSPAAASYPQLPLDPSRYAGNKLRLARQTLGLSLRDVEAASARIAKKYGSGEYLVPTSRLSDFENKGITPSIYRIYSLAVIFRREVYELLSWYGIAPHPLAPAQRLAFPKHSSSGKVSAAEVARPTNIPFDQKTTTSLIPFIEHWGVVPLTYLETFSKMKFTYGYIGEEDLTMYPILKPGTFVQVDESRCRIQNSGWLSPYQRPIYFVETREQYVCCWCTQQAEQIVLESHPLSPVPTRVFDNSEAEIIGQVVGAAFRVDSGKDRFSIL